MKVFSYVAFVLFIGSACSTATDPELEKQKIMNVIETETRSFFGNDHATWRNCFLDTTYFTYLGFWEGYRDTRGIRYHRGYKLFDEMERGDLAYREKKGAGWAYEVSERSDVNIQLSDDIAYVTFSEMAFDRATKEAYPNCFNIRILEKKNNEWKIALISYYFFPDSVKKFDLPLTYRSN